MENFNKSDLDTLCDVSSHVSNTAHDIEIR